MADNLPAKASSSLISRVIDAARYTITGVTPSTWMSPLQPLPPMAPEDVKGRQFDYRVGQNLNYRPRSTEPISFAKLRLMADACEPIRIVLERQKDLMESFEWKIVPRELKEGARPAQSAFNGKIKEIEAFLRYPDQRHDWAQWLRMALEEVYVVDALSIYRRPNRVGELYALEIIDGATITPLIDSGGRSPLPPDPAFQQIDKGIPAADFTADELLYYPKNPRANHIYGNSPVQMIHKIGSAQINRLVSQEAFYTVGNIVDGFFAAPEEMTNEQIKAWQKNWDDMYSGRPNQKHRVPWLPNGVTWASIKDTPLKDEFDEWLIRLICFAFSTSPQPFIKQVSRGNQENQQQVAEEGGIATYLAFMKRVMDRILRDDFGQPELEFSWQHDEVFDPEVQANIIDKKLRAGLITPDEGRDMVGFEPYPDGIGAKPVIINAGGATLLEDVLKDSENRRKGLGPDGKPLPELQPPTGGPGGPTGGGGANPPPRERKPVPAP